MSQLRVMDWEKVLHRWVELEPMPEVNLLIRVLAEAIAGEPDEAIRQGREPFVGGFFSGGFQNYCAALQLNPKFVLEQIAVANASDVVVPKQPARSATHALREKGAAAGNGWSKASSRQVDGGLHGAPAK